MHVYDHTGSLVETIENDGSGFHFPSDIFAVMRQEATKAREKGNIDRWRDIQTQIKSSAIESNDS